MDQVRSPLRSIKNIPPPNDPIGNLQNQIDDQQLIIGRLQDDLSSALSMLNKKNKRIDQLESEAKILKIIIVLQSMALVGIGLYKIFK